MAADLTPAQRALLAQRIGGRRTGRSSPVIATAGPEADGSGTPLSAEQEQLYYHSSLIPQHPIYNEIVAITKDGSLDLTALRRAFTELVARHDVWHSTIRPTGGEPRQFVDPAPTFELPVHDLRDVPESEREQHAADLVVGMGAPRYNLRRGPLLRAMLIRFADEHHRLYLAMHHIIFDGVSLYRVVVPELMALYDAAVSDRPSPLPPPRFQYADYARWERGVIDEQVDRQLPWWREHLADAPTLRLPLARPRSADRQYRGAVEGFVVPPSCVEDCYALAHANGTTLFPVLMAAFASLLRDYGAGDDVVFATVADLRHRPELESMVGYCLTPLPMRLRVPPSLAARDLVRAARDELWDAIDHAVPFERLVRALQPVPREGMTPLFQAMLVLEPPASFTSSQWGLRMCDARIGSGLGATKNDVHMELDERPDGHLMGRVLYNRDLFEKGFGGRVVDDFRRTLTTLTARAQLRRS